MSVTLKFITSGEKFAEIYNLFKQKNSKGHYPGYALTTEFVQNCVEGEILAEENLAVKILAILDEKSFTREFLFVRENKNLKQAIGIFKNVNEATEILEKYYDLHHLEYKWEKLDTYTDFSLLFGVYKENSIPESEFRQKYFKIFNSDKDWKPVVVTKTFWE